MKKPTVANPTADTWAQHLDKITKEVLLTDRWRGSLKPDLVLHFTRNATRIQCIYDFKFPCLMGDRIDPLSGPGVMDQLRSYHALERSCMPAIVTPGHGVYRPDSL